MLNNIHTKYTLAVRPKEGKPYNPVHDKVNGVIVTVIDLTVGERGKLAFEDWSWTSGWNILDTSPIEVVDVFSDGTITVTTRNTVYTLKKIT